MDFNSDTLSFAQTYGGTLAVALLMSHDACVSFADVDLGRLL